MNTLTLAQLKTGLFKNDDAKPANSITNTPMQPTTQPKTLLLEEINGSIDFKILLSERKVAHLIYPENLNEKDIQILKLQLEALALTL